MKEINSRNTYSSYRDSGIQINIRSVHVKTVIAIWFNQMIGKIFSYDREPKHSPIMFFIPTQDVRFGR